MFLCTKTTNTQIPATDSMWRFLIPQMCWRPKSRIWVHHLPRKKRGHQQMRIIGNLSKQSICNKTLTSRRGRREPAWWKCTPPRCHLCAHTWIKEMWKLSSVISSMILWRWYWWQEQPTYPGWAPPGVWGHKRCTQEQRRWFLDTRIRQGSPAIISNILTLFKP